MEKSSFALTIMPRMPRPWMKMMLLTIAAAKRRTRTELAGTARSAAEHDDGQPAHSRGREHEPDDVARGGAGQDAEAAAAAAEDRQPGKPEEDVEPDGGESPAGAQGKAGEHHGERLQGDGDAEAAHRNGGDQGGSCHQRGEDGDQSQVGGVPAVAAPGGGRRQRRRRSVSWEFLSRVNRGHASLFLTVRAWRRAVFCRCSTNRRPGCWRAAPKASRTPRAVLVIGRRPGR